jgi:hypothetical protein
MVELRTLGAAPLYLCALLLLSLLTVETIYRLQLIDAYSPELRAFTPPDNLAADGRPAILIMGDSFTVGRRNYPTMLQDSLPSLRVINAGLGGTGIVHALVIAAERFRTFKPALFVYQVYVGNDLSDIRHPTNWRELSLLRNLYWLASNHLRSIDYINYRLGQIVQARAAPADDHLPGMEPIPGSIGAFQAEQYDGRVKLLLRAEPALLEETILIKGRRQADYDVFLASLERLISLCKPTECQAYVLVIPHVCQVDKRYIGYMRQLGAIFSEPQRIGDTDYPFVAGIEAKFTGQSHVAVLNPLATLKEANRETPIYFSNDEHLTPAGQKAIAALLLEQLEIGDERRGERTRRW